MEKKNIDIIEIGENEISTEYEIEKVDFSEPATIISYGSDIRDKIRAVLESTIESTSKEEEIILDEKEIRKSLNLDASLDESDKNSSKKDLALIENVKKLLTKAGLKIFKEKIIVIVQDMNITLIRLMK